MVLVSHQYKFIFCKTGKTAGTSIEMALEPACAKPRHKVREKVKTTMSKYGIIGSRMTPCISTRTMGTWCNHKSAEDIRNDLGTARFDAYTKITAVRNPFDRCVSAFHWKFPKISQQASGFASLREGFRDFIKSRNWKDDRANVFVNGRYIIDRAIRFERLPDDLGIIASDLSLPFAPILPHTKSTAKTRRSFPVADYYDQTCIDIVRERMSWVFERFSYPDHPQFAQDSLS